MMRALLLLALWLVPLAAQANETTLAYSGCKIEQQDELRTALVRADASVETALALLDQGKADAYLTTWFGSTDARLTVSKTLRSVHERLQSTRTLTLICEERNCEHNMVGYVEQNSISVCPEFFSSAPADAYDSQMGTLIHELTHYTASTTDHAYGTADARRLAAKEPEKALENADNYQYFVEALTGLIRDGDQPYNEANSCKWAYDGECDEKSHRGTGACQPGTDTADCARPAPALWQSRPRKPDYFGVRNPDDSCPTNKNGVCDEPGRGGNDKCRVGSDISDCDPSYNPKRR